MNSLLLFVAFLLPHGDLSIRIAEKTAAIQAEPDNLLLYMQRGELHALHEQPDSALIDYRFAIENGLDTSAVHILMAEAQLTLGLLDEGLRSVEAFLAAEPRHLKGIHVRAQLLEVQGWGLG